jgi:hypothetical protein
MSTDAAASARRRGWAGGLARSSTELDQVFWRGATINQKLEALRAMAEAAWMMEGHVTAPRLQDILAVFAKHGVEYLLVGGYAVGFHGTPRFTKDLDLWVRPSRENLDRVRGALVEFGAPAALVSQLDSASEEDVLWMGAAPVRIDILKGVPGGNFAHAYARRVVSEWDGTSVSIVGREDLIALKRVSGRPQDIVDADMLERA